jgi:dTDP-4-dehydrorhamnose reductase
MIKLLVLGSTGMLGSQVIAYLDSTKKFDITGTYRQKIDGFLNFKMIGFNALTDDIQNLSTDFDYVINCIGVIKPFMKENIIDAIELNSIFPHQLAEWCVFNSIKLIHITTDCVYSGLRGQYNEEDEHDALDDYGKSKSLGEPSNKSMVIRTSIIGEEIHKYASLISWVKSQKGREVGGFSTHMWNGVTTKEYAKICERIIVNNLFEYGLFHVFAKNDVSKLELISLLNLKFNLGLSIVEKQPTKVDRTLRSKKNLVKELMIPTVQEMIFDL